MAITAALIGARGTSSGSSATTTGGTSTGGHGILVTSYDPGVTVSGTITDSKSNTFTIIGSVQSDVNEGRLAVYRCFNWSVGGSHTVTVNYSGTAFPVVHLIEIRGAASSPLDIDVAETDTAQPCEAASGTLAQAAELILICGACNEIAGDGEYTTTTGSILSSEPQVSNFWTSGVGYQVVAATTSANYNIRRNSPTTSGGGHIRLISFKEAVADIFLGQACL